MEVSYPTEILQKDLNEVSKIHSHFLVKKSVFDSKAWLVPVSVPEVGPWGLVSGAREWARRTCSRSR